MSAFPKNERFPFVGLLAMALQKRVNLQAVYDHDNFIGLIFGHMPKRLFILVI